jgi:predicted O-methyltransferase YrrM
LSSKTLALTDPLRDYLLRHGVREDALLAELRTETAALPEARMQIAPEQGAFMAVLARAIGARRALEIGTFTGYSSLVVARALPEDGMLVCCDVSPAFTAIARRYWERAGVSSRIRLHLAPALETLDRLRAEGADGTFDLAFVDADKGNYSAYVDRALALLRTGGVLLIDNVLWSGSVADPADVQPDTVAIRALNTQLATDPRVDLAMLPVGDGLTMCCKR